ncbi:hypothetical protein EON82_08130 [bacterium]|nr:MAG: hypothetical protein EON82_08130 [bacterium]
MPSPEPRPYAPLTSRYGSIGQGGEWREAIEAYYWDRMPESFAIAQALGAGFGGAALRWYRMIEGEALTRERARIEEITDTLSVEFDPDEFTLDEAHKGAIPTATETVARRLGWDFSMGVRVAILVEEVDAPWHGARFGYCVDKYPYEKVCVPFRSAVDPDELYRVMAHEFTHAVTLNLTQGRIPHWLDEGLAMLMENAPARRTGNWLDPEALNAAFEADRRDEEGLSRSGAAYVQSAQIVRHLHAVGGDEKLAQLLRAFTNNNLWDEIKINLLGEPSVEEALHEVYGFGQRELFGAAR